jgi:hypothetical protein
MLLYVLRQIDERPVGLPQPAQVSWGLTGQHHDGRLPLRAIEPGRGPVRAITQPGQAPGGKAVPPLRHGVPHQSQFRGNGRIPRPLRRAQHHRGPPRQLLRTRPRAHHPLQLCPFLVRQNNRLCSLCHARVPRSTLFA